MRSVNHYKRAKELYGKYREIQDQIEHIHGQTVQRFKGNKQSAKIELEKDQEFQLLVDNRNGTQRGLLYEILMASMISLERIVSGNNSNPRH